MGNWEAPLKLVSGKPGFFHVLWTVGNFREWHDRQLNLPAERLAWEGRMGIWIGMCAFERAFEQMAQVKRDL